MSAGFGVDLGDGWVGADAAWGGVWVCLRGLLILARWSWRYGKECKGMMEQ